MIHLDELTVGQLRGLLSGSNLNRGQPGTWPAHLQYAEARMQFLAWRERRAL